MQNSYLDLLLKSSLCLAVFPLSAVFAQVLTPGPAAKPPIEALAAVATAVKDDTASKAVYRAPGTDLTVGELSAEQRKKMEEDFFKRAGFTSTQPTVIAKNRPLVAVTPKAVHAVSIVGVYGPAYAKKVDLSFNGELVTLQPNGRFMNVTVESIEPTRVVLVYTKKNTGKSIKTKKDGAYVRHTLKPGDVLELPA